MAPAPQANQLLAEAAQKLMTAVQDTGLAEPTPFATALLELIESSAKLQEFDDMAAEAKTKQSVSEEAQTWQQISLMTLQFCREGMVDRQQKALQKVMEMASQGASLSTPGAAAAPLEAEISTTVPVAKSTPCVSRPPPGLAAPPGLSAPPGLEVQTTKAGSEKEKLPPWRRNKPKASKSYKEATLPSSPEGPPKNVDFFADQSFWGSQLNLDAYDSD